MHAKYDYTARARKLTYRFPVFSFIMIQITFWIVAFLLFSTITSLNTLYLSEIGSPGFPVSFRLVFINSGVMGVLLGAVLGFVEILIDRFGVKRLSVGLIILLRIAIYPVVLFCIISLVRFVLVDWITPHLSFDYGEILDSPETWSYLYLSLLIYTALMAAVISFINQMNNKFGPGIIIPLLLGRYRKPKEQERFFMFIDMKSSTMHAEELGHLKFSALIRDCFIDLNQVSTRNNAEIYQYVGDEVVVTWHAYEGIRNMACLSLFFDFQDELQRMRDYYLKHYGFVPEFKAGLHQGVITVVEVGSIKRDIAYHGDTINTAARIQGLCNQFDKAFLISDSVRSILPENDEHYRFESLGEKSLKGKDKTVELFSVQKKFVS